MSIIIKDVMCNGEITDIYIEDRYIVEIGKHIEADIVLDGKNKAIISGFVNTHTHSPMILFRGFADDMKLNEWLTTRIWPIESKLNSEYVYWGAKLACIEMIKSGTTTFNDMYFFIEDVARAVDEIGLRAVLSYGFIDLFDDDKREMEIKKTETIVKYIENMRNDRILPALGPHAVYTVSRDGLEWIKEYAKEKNLLIHIHLAETKKENDEFLQKEGVSPVKYLEKIELLNDNLIAAHSIWITENDIKILKKYNVKVSYNPISNAKLGSGVMPYINMQKYGLLVTLGTDGCASNNNLDMLEEMKFGSLIQKLYSMNETILSANEIFNIATANGAEALGINTGKIKEGMLADIVMVDLKQIKMIPLHNFISNLVYSADSNCIDTVICNGKILMKNRKVNNEEEIYQKVKRYACELVASE